MAKFEKGNKASKGRPKGVPNKTTTQLKETINAIVSKSLDYYLEDIEKIRVKNPEKALELSKGLIEYVLPKMSKLDLSGELTHKVEKITVEIKDGTIDEPTHSDN